MKAIRMTLGVMCAAASITTWACEDGTFTPATGTLLVTTLTTGDAIDGDGFQILLDDQESSVIGVNETVTFTLDVDDYTVELTGLDDPCVVDGDNPVSAAIAADESTTVSFSVACESM